MIVRFFPLVALALSVLPAHAQDAPPTAPPAPFLETPGSREFTGVLIARPLQVADAARYGLSVAETEARLADALDALGNHAVVDHVGATDETLVAVAPGTEYQVAAALMAGGGFEYVEPDWRVFPLGCPDDPMFASQWHHISSRLNSCAAWDLETGDPSVVVAVCDTGVRRSHEDLLLHRREAYNAVDQLWESGGASINDINGHGTAVTGCAAANGDNGVGVSGVGQNLGHRMLRVSNQGNGASTISILNHASRVAADVGDKVVTVSYSGVGSSSVNTTGTYVRDKGALLVWAAGNDGKSLPGVRDDDVIVVGATATSDLKPTFTNYGPRVDLMAPGVGVTTTNSSSNSSYSAEQGTSFAAPLVAGLCGLLYSADPSLTPQEVEDALRQGCDDLGAPGVDDDFGYGRIDCYESLALVPICPAPETYCQTSSNSNGPGSVMSGFGSQRPADDDFTLRVDGSMPDQYGMFFYGRGVKQVPLGDGYLCIAGETHRLGPNKASANGAAIERIDFDRLPPGGKMQAGETWYFQWWYRDPGASSKFNFSNGLEVTWCQ